MLFRSLRGSTKIGSQQIRCESRSFSSSRAKAVSNFAHTCKHFRFQANCGSRSLGRVFCALSVFCAAAPALAQRVWIDTDVAIGSPLREVDDAFALGLTFHSGQLRVAGISTSYGNASLSRVDRVARDMTDRFGSPAHLSARNVYSGARSASDLGRATPASQALALALRKQRLTYIAIGPLTNLATVLQLHPELAHRINRVVFLGGITPGERLTFGLNKALVIHDANVQKDPAAVVIVLRSGAPILLIPIGTAGKLMIDANDLNGIAASGPSGTYLAQRSKVWLWFWKNIARASGGPLFDAVAVIATLEPRFIVSEGWYARVEQSGTLLVRAMRTDGARPVRYCPALKTGIKTVLLHGLERAVPPKR